jgi:hypothetical protein
MAPRSSGESAAGSALQGADFTDRRNDTGVDAFGNAPGANLREL